MGLDLHNLSMLECPFGERRISFINKKKPLNNNNNNILLLYHSYIYV
jgi:aminoglycoside phosphotransferase